MDAPSPFDASAVPSPLHETARGHSHRRPSSRPAPTPAIHSAGTHPRTPSPALAATTLYGTVQQHVPPSSRVLMPWKGSTLINMVDQRTLSDKQHHHSQSQCSDYADDGHWSTENTQQLGDASSHFRCTSFSSTLPIIFSCIFLIKQSLHNLLNFSEFRDHKESQMESPNETILIDLLKEHDVHVED